MKIAILTSGILPVPAVQGGAVENLIDYYLEYNDKHRLHDITVYSIADKATRHHTALKSQSNHYRYIQTNSLLARLKKALLRKTEGYYNYTIEYYLNETLRRLRRRSYDVIIVENRPGFILKLRQKTGARCILHLHNDFLHHDIQSADVIFDGFDRIISVSDHITSRVRQIRPDTSKCVTVHNAIDLQHFHQATAFERSTVGLTDDDFVIVYSGRLRQEKGILELVQAIKALPDIPHIKLLVVGASAYGQDKFRNRFIAKLEKESEPVINQIVFTGFVPYATIPSYLKMADIAVVPSIWEEPFGLTVVEAMAAGIPLITTRSGGIPEICDNEAVLVGRDAIVDNLATAIRDLYEHPEKRAQLAAAALARSSQFDKETYAKNFFAAIE